MDIYWLADRLKKTPEEIRLGFSMADYDGFQAYLRKLKEQAPNR